MKQLNSVTIVCVGLNRLFLSKEFTPGYKSLTAVLDWNWDLILHGNYVGWGCYIKIVDISLSTRLFVSALSLALLGCGKGFLAVTSESSSSEMGSSNPPGQQPEPMPPPVPSPSPSNPSPGSLPSKIVGGWWWPYNPPSIAGVQSGAPEINYLAVYLEPTTSEGQVETGKVSNGGWVYEYSTEAHFASDLAAWRASGRVLTADVGGGVPCGDSPAILDSTNVSEFMSSIGPIISAGGYEGVEFDLEDAADCQRVDPPSLARLIQQLKTTYGPSFVITLDPAPFTLRQCSTSPWTWSACGPTGEYRQVILDAGIENIDLVAVQDYALLGDSLAAQQQYMNSDLADWTGNLTGLLIPASKILIGSSGSCVTQGGCGSGNESSVTAIETYQYYLGIYPSLRGNMNWETNMDSKIGWALAVGIAATPLP